MTILSKELEKILLKQYSFLEKRKSIDWIAFNLPSDHLLNFCRGLRDEHGFNILIDIAGIDWDKTEPKYAVAYHLYSITKNTYLRLVVSCESEIQPTLPSVVSIWPAADWHEREAFDMIGVIFMAHPNLRRILMWDSYPYHPLRKNFPLAGIEVNLPAADITEESEAKVESAPMMGGPFRAKRSSNQSKNSLNGLD